MGRTRHKKTYQRILLKALPCVLFLAAIFCFSYYFFEAVIVDSTVWSLLVASDAAVSNTGMTLKTKMQTPEPGESDVNDGSSDNGYRNLEDFPVITWGEQWATLSIPAHGVEQAPVFLGDGNDILNQMVIGQFFSSSFPGQPGKTVLDSHVSGAFHCLEDMKEGERIILDTIYGRYEYEVTEILIFTPEQKDVVRPDKSEEDRLLCYTCYPRAAAYRTQRIGVLCRKVSGAVWQ